MESQVVGELEGEVRRQTDRLSHQRIRGSARWFLDEWPENPLSWWNRTNMDLLMDAFGKSRKRSSVHNSVFAQQVRRFSPLCGGVSVWVAMTEGPSTRDVASTFPPPRLSLVPGLMRGQPSLTPSLLSTRPVLRCVHRGDGPSGHPVVPVLHGGGHLGGERQRRRASVVLGDSRPVVGDFPARPELYDLSGR